VTQQTKAVLLAVLVMVQVVAVVVMVLLPAAHSPAVACWYSS